MARVSAGDGGVGVLRGVHSGGRRAPLAISECRMTSLRRCRRGTLVGMSDEHEERRQSRLDLIERRLRERMEAEGVVAGADHSKGAEAVRSAHVGSVKVRGVPSAAGTVLGIDVRTALSLGAFGALCWWFLAYDPVKGMDLNYRGPKIKVGKSGQIEIEGDDGDEGDEDGGDRKKKPSSEGRKAFIPSPPFGQGRHSADDEEDSDFDGDDELDLGGDGDVDFDDDE